MKLLDNNNTRRSNSQRDGRTNEPEYLSWVRMQRRCYEPKYKGYKHYGGRGITVCDDWRNDYRAFVRDVGRKPSPKHSLDRINNDGNYEPGNCRWATIIEQVRNRRPIDWKASSAKAVATSRAKSEAALAEAQREYWASLQHSDAAEPR